MEDTLHVPCKEATFITLRNIPAHDWMSGIKSSAVYGG